MTEMDSAVSLVEPDVESSTPGYKNRFGGSIGRWFIERQCNGLIKLLADLPNKENVIDFGGGHGQNIRPLKEMGYEVMVLGSAESCSQMITEQLADGDASFLLASLVDSGLDDRSVQVATSFRMLPHLDNWPAHIQELCRVADQSVVVEFPTTHSVNVLSSRFFGLKKQVEKNTRTFNLFSVKEIEQEFKKHGFSPVGRVGQYVLPMALYRLLKITFVAKVVEGIMTALGISKYVGSPMICRFDRGVKNA